jgi:hypothetical protein
LNILPIGQVQDFVRTSQIAAEQAGQSAGIDPELLMKVLTNPEMAKLLKALAGTIE